jgi:adiponectin receptor
MLKKSPPEPEREFIGELKHLEDEGRKSNHYIVRGYRINFTTPKRVLKSLFMIHNESVNIWSHLLGAVLFVMLLYHTVVVLDIEVGKVDCAGIVKSTGVTEQLNEYYNNAIAVASDSEWVRDLGRRIDDIITALATSENCEKLYELILNTRSILVNSMDKLTETTQGTINALPI